MIFQDHDQLHTITIHYLKREDYVIEFIVYTKIYLVVNF